MRISELISKLTELKELHGDIDVQVNDNEKGWDLNVADLQYDGTNVVIYGNLLEF